MLNLQKGGDTLNLTKGGNDAGKIVFGLGWQGSFGRSLDLDSYIAVLDSTGRVLDFIYFSNKRGAGIQHNGDDLVGGRKGKDVPNETIEIELSKLDSKATNLIAGLFIYSGASDLSKVDFAFSTLTNQSGSPVVRFDVKDFKGAKSVDIASIDKVNNEWVFTAVGKPSSDGYSETLSRFRRGSQAGSPSAPSTSSSGGSFLGNLARSLFGS